MLHAEAWYAVWTRSHCERLVAQQLSAKGFATFLPEVRTRATRVGPARFAPAPMFPGYLFVRESISKSRYIDMLQARGIVRVLEDGWTRLTPVPDADIAAIERLLQSGLPIFPHPHLSEGDRVRVVAGALTGVEGLFVHGKEQKDRLVLSVNLLGRSVAVEVDAVDVMPCPRPFMKRELACA